MNVLIISLAVFLALILLTAYICFYLAFYVPQRTKTNTEEFPIPPGKIYEEHRDTMISWMKEVRKLPYEEFLITSSDGLALYGKYYECKPGAPIELMFHGYRGSAERDLCGGVQRCFALERNVLIVDQRTSGKSQGNVITFGVKESKDCLLWIDCLIKRFGPNVKIWLTGISMGASTVMLAAGEALPSNVVGILADCGYTTAKSIIKKVIRQMHLPATVLYPFVRLGALLYGGFDPNKASCPDAMKKCRVPAIFVHGEADDFVPCEMSFENYAACNTAKCLITVPNAGHGLAYLLDREGYLRTLKEFCENHEL